MPKLNREYRQAGAESMFAAAYRQAKQARESSMMMVAPPQSAPSSPSRPTTRGGTANAGGGNNTFFITGGGADSGLADPETAAVEEMAADVMDQVGSGAWMSVIASLAVLLLLLAYVHIQLLESLGMDTNTAISEIEVALVGNVGRFNSSTAPAGGGDPALMQRMTRVPSDVVAGLGAGGGAAGPGGAASKGGLSAVDDDPRLLDSLSALRALKFALDHPLTNDREVRMGSYARPTAAALHQRVEKHVPLQDLHDVSVSSDSLGAHGTAAAAAAAPFPSRQPRHKATSAVAAPPPRTDEDYDHGYSRQRNKRIADTFRAGSQKTTASALVLAQLDEILGDLNTSAGVVVTAPNRGRNPGGGGGIGGTSQNASEVRGKAGPAAKGASVPGSDMHPGILSMIAKTHASVGNV